MSPEKTKPAADTTITDSSKSARIFVAGHQGMVGSAILRVLDTAGYSNILVRSRQQLDLTNQLAVESFFERESIDTFDLNDSHVLPALIRKFHLAKLAHNNSWDAIDRDIARFGAIPDSDYKELKSQGETCVNLWGTGAAKREFLHVDDRCHSGLWRRNSVGQQSTGRNVAKTARQHPNPCHPLAA